MLQVHGKIGVEVLISQRVKTMRNADFPRERPKGSLQVVELSPLLLNLWSYARSTISQSDPAFSVQSNKSQV